MCSLDCFSQIHTDVCTEAILSNLASASCRLVHTWFKINKLVFKAKVLNLKGNKERHFEKTQLAS